MTKLKAIVMRVADGALKGDYKASRLVLEHAERWFDEDPEAAVETPEEDLGILQRALSDPQLRRQMTGEQERQRDPEPGDREESGDD